MTPEILSETKLSHTEIMCIFTNRNN